MELTKVNKNEQGDLILSNDVMLRDKFWKIVEGMVTVCFKAVFRGSIHNHPFI
jgi:hypothetical protein